MVEHQHGLSSFLSFGAKSVQPEILEKLLVGREKVAKTLEKKVKNIVNDGLNHQVIVVGARGTGKTHLLRILYHRMESDIQSKKIVVAYFAEEEYGIAGYLDFMVRILNAFIRWNEEDAPFLKEQLSILQETPSSHQEETVERIIKSYIKDKPLLILVENFNDILETLKIKGQSKLRAWLYRNERTSIIATAQALSDDVGREDRPFYGFFDEIHLKKLTFDQSYELLKSLAKIEKREDVLEHLNTKGLAQVKAIHRLVKGNHRLLVTFYEFLKADLLSDLSVTFIKTLNDLKPYYETYIRFLPPQQQKILRFIAMAKIPQQGTEIARQCFIDTKSLSKQLSELTKKKLIEAIVDTSDKRNKLYDISEPLLRLSIEIGEHKEGVNALFIDFLALYYENNELEAQKNRFSEMLLQCSNHSDLQKYNYEIQARERALEVQKSFISEPTNEYNDVFDKQVQTLLEKGKGKEALELLEAIQPKNRNNINWIFLASTYAFLGMYQKSIDIFQKIEMDNHENFGFYNLWGLSLSLIAEMNKDEKIFKTAIEKYKKAHELNSNSDSLLYNWGNALLNLAILNKGEKIFKLAVEKFKNADKINPKDEWILFSLGRTLFYLAEINNNEKLYESATQKFREVIKINSKNLDALFGLGTSLMILTELKGLERNNSLFVESLEVLFEYYVLAKNSNHLGFKSLQDIVPLMMYSPKFLTLNRCQQLEKIIKENLNLPKELQIPYQYLQTYRKVVLQGEEKALYELPKEQREFFEQEILGKKEK